MDGVGEARGGLDQIAGDFARLSRMLAEESGGLDPERLVRVAAHVTPHAEHCAITLMVASQPPRTVAATGSLPEEVDRIQYATEEGPCLRAMTHDGVTLVEDLRTDPRWPAFSARCVAETPVRSMLSTRLALDSGRSAAMNLYAYRPNQFADLDIGVASMFAPFVALAVQSRLDQQQVSGLQSALTSSRQIGTAIGILMARELVTSQQAFDLLRSASNHLNRKLRDIADEVVDTGGLPGGAPIDR